MSAKVTPSMLKVLRACAAGDDLRSARRVGLAPHIFAKAELECRKQGLKFRPNSNELTDAGKALVAP